MLNSSICNLMSRKVVAILPNSPPDYNEEALRYFLLSINKIQKYYEFVFPEIQSKNNNLEFYYTTKHYEKDELFSSYKSHASKYFYFEQKPDYIINIISSAIGENLFFICDKNISFITTNNWERTFSPPSLFEYLLHCIMASLLFMNEKISISSSHRETRGCCLDFTYYKMDDRVDIALGYICDSCKEKILQAANKDYLEEIEHIISRKWIGELNQSESVAHNLKKFFNFNINKDSGFNKTTWEKVIEHFYEIPKGIILLIAGAIIGIILTNIGVIIDSILGLFQ